MQAKQAVCVGIESENEQIKSLKKSEQIVPFYHHTGEVLLLSNVLLTQSHQSTLVEHKSH